MRKSLYLQNPIKPREMQTKSLNLLSVIQAYEMLDKDLFHKFMNSCGIAAGTHGGIKEHELKGIGMLVENLMV